MDEVPAVVPEVQQSGIDDDSDSPDEEGDPRPRRGPIIIVHRPTAIDMVEHSRTHIPYRVWCPYCAARRGGRDGGDGGKQGERQPHRSRGLCGLCGVGDVFSGRAEQVQKYKKMYRIIIYKIRVVL